MALVYIPSNWRTARVIFNPPKAGKKSPNQISTYPPVSVINDGEGGRQVHSNGSIEVRHCIHASMLPERADRRISRFSTRHYII